MTAFSDPNDSGKARSIDVAKPAWGFGERTHYFPIEPNEALDGRDPLQLAGSRRLPKSSYVVARRLQNLPISLLRHFPSDRKPRMFDLTPASMGRLGVWMVEKSLLQQAPGTSNSPSQQRLPFSQETSISRLPAVNVRRSSFGLDHGSEYLLPPPNTSRYAPNTSRYTPYNSSPVWPSQTGTHDTVDTAAWQISIRHIFGAVGSFFHSVGMLCGETLAWIKSRVA